jgi:hypothetical protein
VRPRSSRRAAHVDNETVAVDLCRDISGGYACKLFANVNRSGRPRPAPALADCGDFSVANCSAGLTGAFAARSS